MRKSVGWLIGCATLMFAAAAAQETPSGPTRPSETRAQHEAPTREQLEPALRTSDTPSTPAGGAQGVGSQSGNIPSAAPSTSAPGANAATGAAGPRSSSVPKARVSPTSDSTPSRAHGGKAQDRIELDPTQITGNRELPKVLYIVPWKRAELGDLTGKPLNSLVDEVLQPVDRDVFKRQNRYYEALQPDAGTAAVGPAP